MAARALPGPGSVAHLPPDFCSFREGRGFILADDFIRQLLSFRSCWIAGRYGSGKTILSLAVSDYMLHQRFVARAVSNVAMQSGGASYYNSLEYHLLFEAGLIPPLVAGFRVSEFVESYHARFGIYPSPEDIEGLMLDDQEGAKVYDAAVIFDEAHSSVAASGSASKRALRAVTAFLRKRNLVVMLPSVLPIYRDLSFFRVQREWNLFPFGLRVWIYRWEVRTPIYRLKGRFALRPGFYFGLLDTFFEPPAVMDDVMLSLLLAGVNESQQDERVIDSTIAFSVWSDQPGANG